ncbi:major facilitator superfamily domain-containing protein [Phyllosticta citriasiana]|uniref:Major facilitator superfamily domain-containing protein n=1 Tax=Phyllosticta citriasiana TaxID=595635 RepID=A0ABR1KI41_9PEZI
MGQSDAVRVEQGTPTSTPEKTLEQPSPPYSAFPQSTRRLILFAVTCAGFFGPLAGAVYLPAIPLFSSIFHTEDDVISATVSVYMAIFAVSPLAWGAFADHKGRRPVYLVSLAIFIVANVILAAVPANIGALFVLRIFQAMGSSAVASVGAGTVADIVEPSKRASALSIFFLGPQLGPVLGPLIGGQFAAPERWRWSFGFLAIGTSIVYVLIVVCLPETLRALVGNGQGSVANTAGRWKKIPPFIQPPTVDPSVKRPQKPSLKLSFTLLCYVPNLIITCSGAIQFAALYCILVSFTRMWKTLYGYTEAEAGYAYLCPGVLLIVGSLASGKVSDWWRARAIKASPTGKVPPESRIILQTFGYALAAAGLLMFGWFCEHRIHPAAVMIASAIGAFGMGWVFVTTTSYQTECYPSYGASLVALGQMMRNIGGAIAAVVIQPLIEAMGYGWCFTGLSILTFSCIFGVIYLRFTGDSWRKKLDERTRARS